jgi:hypothetical protein
MVEPEEASQEKMRSMNSVNLDGLHVLVVDDEADIRELVNAIARLAEFELADC